MIFLTTLIAMIIVCVIVGILGFIAWYVDKHPNSKIAKALEKIDNIYYHN
jgi:Tfp pilus assembly protein PilE